MNRKKNIYRSRPTRNTWRDYQRLSYRKGIDGSIIRLMLLILFLPIALIFYSYRTTAGDAHYIPQGEYYSRIQKSNISYLLKGVPLINAEEKSFDVTLKGHDYHVDTSLDISLQNYLMSRLHRKNSRYIGIVVMEPETGRILSMVGYDKTQPDGNPCLDNRFPAASIFKIVTAAAAVETHRYGADTVFNYNGSKYTLYRNQLKDLKNRYTHSINLRDSFAQSVNPVFGKLGAKQLGPSLLEKYAEAFGFNRMIRFELPLMTSTVELTDKPYQWAEVASGFNRETTLSPVHGALIVATILNQGRMVEPTVVDDITDAQGKTVYRSQTTYLNRVISKETSGVLNQLMQATVRSGTSRKAFRGSHKDRILSRLVIGGKTGSINSESQDTRFDWFVGFAKAREGREALALSIVVGHEKYIGIRASRYAKMAIRRHFKHYYAKDVATSAKQRESS